MFRKKKFYPEDVELFMDMCKIYKTLNKMYVFNIMREKMFYVSDELTNELDWKYNLEILPAGEFSMVHNLAKIYKTLEKRKTF
jgi:hypothetical protein